MLFLSRVEGFTHAEIAEQMGVSQSLVEKYLIKAILHCRAQLVFDR
jgi:DNA-directed RNA polymerase specialized sigma24 family protein